MDIKKYIRPTLGIIFLLIGIISSFTPVIPVLGVVGLFAGAFLLAPYIPFFAKIKEWVKSKDRSGKTEQVEKKLEDIEKEKKRKSEH